MLTIILILATIGFAISLYAYITEQQIKMDRSYKPACDLSDRISCSKPMLSPYANLLFFSNNLVGVAYYILVAFLAYFDQVNLVFYAVIANCLFSCFLAYLLIFKIRSFCILCVSLYVVNIAMLIVAYKAFHM